MRQLYKELNIPKEDKLYEGLDKFYHTIIGRIKSFYINTFYKNKIKKYSKKIYDLSLEYDNLSDRELNDLIFECRKKTKLNKLSDKEFIQTLALICEVVYREFGFRVHSVQIMAVISLIDGYFIQMATGEGKTITAAISAVVIGWKKGFVHIVTSNDYLASRDAINLAKFYSKFGLRCGYIVEKTKKDERKKIYSDNIVYTTSKEILADFLKSKMDSKDDINIDIFLLNKLSNGKTNNFVLGGFEAVIIDEADSVLSDDAITPLIISSKAKNDLLKDSVIKAYKISSKLQKDKDYIVDKKNQDIILKDSGIDIIKKYSQELGEIWSFNERREFLIKQALQAKEFFKLNKQYIIKDKKIVLVDEKTGRIMKDRSWSNGLQQAIEIKEGLEVTDLTITFAKMSFQRFFRLYKHLCGMSGTLQNLTDEFYQIYNKNIIKIPTHLPTKMKFLPTDIYIDKKTKELALVKYVCNLRKNSQIPILIGTSTIKDSEKIYNLLKDKVSNIKLLNAINSYEEADIIKDAGKLNKITVATNMAGRGTDIKIDNDINNMGGLHVILIEKNVSKRVDMQFFGRCARHGQNGVVKVFLSLDDKILQNCLHPIIKNIFKRYFNFTLTKYIVKILYTFCQKRVEKYMSKMRNKTLFNELRAEESTSFSRF